MEYIGGFLMAIPFILWIGIWIWAFFDALSWPEEVWREAGESKTLWLLLILVLQFFGTLFYWWRIRPKLMGQ